MTIISKAAGAAGLASCISDIHKTAVLYSNNKYAKSSSDAFLSNALGTQKADRVSVRDAERKNWLLNNNCLVGIKGTLGRIGGYFHGLAQGIYNHLPSVVLSLGSICAKNKTIASLSAIGLAGVELFDFIKNSTGIFQRTDYLK